MSDLNAFLAEEGSDETPATEETTPPGAEFEQQADAAETHETEQQEQPADSDEPPAGLDKRGEAIWREERTKRKELQAHVEKMNDRWMELVTRMQTQQPPQQQVQPEESKPDQETIEVPDYEDDPIGHLAAKNRILEQQMAQFQQMQKAQEQQQQQAGQFQQLQQGVAQMEQEFAKSTPDYHEAVGFMYNNVAKMAQAMGYPPQQIQQTISQMAMDISMRALQEGKNPAQAAYEAAKQMGYAGPKPPETEEEPPARPQAPTSLSTVAGKRSAPAGIPSLDNIAKMDDAEFEKLWKEMEKAARH